jgi:hypothetical protein
MRKILVIALMLVLLVGCRKIRKASTETSAPPPNPEAPAVHAPTGVVINPGFSGGSGGAVQAVRGTALSAVTRNELKNIQLFIDSASGVSGQMPTSEEVIQALKKEDPKAWDMIQKQEIILTGTRSRETIWAYCSKPLRSGEHMAVTNSGIINLTPQALEQRVVKERGQ